MAIIGFDITTDSQSAKMNARRRRWSDVNRERRGAMKKASGNLLICEYRGSDDGDRTDKAVRGDGEGCW